ncbi:hypothetical protein ACH5RR_025828 [Cinchona calisaya]|uniref:Uncharacterized protein n=1 Tax=Cinchona calisaya TaxID=153742 RepID=A0ABD2Z0S1_9GENT
MLLGPSSTAEATAIAFGFTGPLHSQRSIGVKEESFVVGIDWDDSFDVVEIENDLTLHCIGWDGIGSDLIGLDVEDYLIGYGIGVEG